MYDCIVVGFGIAGIAATAHLEAQDKNVLVIDANEVKASVVAAGLYNPVILKRFSMAWNADRQLEYAKLFYKALGVKLDDDFNEPLEVLRRFNSVKEQNSWFSKLDNPGLNKYMSDTLYDHQINSISSSFDYGKLEGTGRVLVKKLIVAYMAQLKTKTNFLEETFDYLALKINKGSLEYKGHKAKQIIFCEGYRLKGNPYFNYLPLVGNKGSYIIVECEDLQLTKALKAHFFLIPLGDNQYKFGATYENHFKDTDHDTAAKAQLAEELEKLISAPYKLISQQTGVRPTVIDRRPLVGQHSKHKQLFVCNGMGTRGVIIAPTAAKCLIDFIVKNEPIPSEINITRFEKG